MVGAVFGGSRRCAHGSRSALVAADGRWAGNVCLCMHVYRMLVHACQHAPRWPHHVSLHRRSGPPASPASVNCTLERPCRVRQVRERAAGRCTLAWRGHRAVGPRQHRIAGPQADLGKSRDIGPAAPLGLLPTDAQRASRRHRRTSPRARRARVRAHHPLRYQLQPRGQVARAHARCVQGYSPSPACVQP